MQRFFYNERIKITGLISQLNAAMELYNTRHYNTDKAVIQLLKDAVPTYKALGYADKECQLQSLQAEFVTAQRGINPYTLLKQTIRRSEMLSTVTFKILQAMEMLFRTDYTAGEEKLQQASALVSQIIVAAMQANLLTDSDIENSKTQQDTAAIWKKIGVDSNISLGQKRVLLIVSSYDALIVFDELLSALKK